MFQPLGYDATFAEMTSEQKNLLSHRAAAFGQMTSKCFT
jgi:inosine/xanthosine triphosphate pyrophosphatase family protein